MVRSVIALGSNLGDRLHALNGAVDRLSEIGVIHSLSGLYETAPIGGPEQSSFYNAVVVLDSELSGAGLLSELHRIEAEFDRVRDVRWGPRTLDLDLILHGDEVIDSETLVLPHPRYRERRFVLEPLLDAWTDAHDPDGTPLADVLALVSDQEIEPIRGVGWVGEQVLSEVHGEASHSRGGVWVVAQLGLLSGFFGVALFGPSSFGSELARSIGLAVAAVGLVQLFVSFRGLGRHTSPYPQPVPGGSLVGVGIYRYVRHPMYGAVLMITFGVASWAGSLVALALWPLLVWFFVAKIGHEEALLIVAYPGYGEYRAAVTRRFVPWIV